MKLKLILLFLFAFFIRLISLNQSLWLDETTTARVVHDYNFLNIITTFSPNDFHPPFFYLFMKVWTSIFGYSEIALRMPSILFSLGAGYVIYLISRFWPNKNDNVGFWAAAFFLLNPLIIYYSQEARMYMFITFLTTIAFYYFLKTIQLSHYEEVKVWDIIFFNFVIFLSFLTFYGSVFFIASIYLYLLWKKEWKLFLLMFPGFLLSLLFISPLLLHQLQHSRVALQSVANWSSVLGAVDIKNLLLIPVKFTSGRISFDPKIFYYSLAGIWMLVVTFFAIRAGMKDKKLAYFFIMPLVLGIIFSFFSPLLQYFRFLYLIPIMSLLLAISSPRYKVANYILATGFVIWSLTYLMFPKFHREDWKSLVVQANITSVIPTVYMTPTAFDPYIYYSYFRQRPNLYDLTTLKKQSPRHSRILVIPYAADIYGIDYKALLNSYGYELVKTSSVRGLTSEYWQKTK